jgi:hypothetical protein
VSKPLKEEKSVTKEDMGVFLAHVLSLSLILSPFKVLESRINNNKIIQLYCIIPFVSFEQYQKALRKSKKKKKK